MGWSVVAGRQMFRQIHAVMQQAKDVDGLAFCRLEHNKVAAFSAKSRHMQSANSGADIVPLSGPQNSRAVVQSLNRLRHGFDVIICLARPEILCRPHRNVLQVKFGLISQPKLPALAHGAGFALLDTDFRCDRNEALESKTLNRPDSMSERPTCAAARSASRR